MKVGIDFDRVLFDTEAFKKHVKQEIEGFGDTYEDALTKKGMYDPVKHAEILGILEEELFSVLEHSNRFLYPDVEELENIPDRFEPVIVSRGDQKFQSMKIENSGVMEHFSAYILVQEQSKDVGIDFLIDDRKYELERAEIPENRTFLFDRSKHGVADVVEWLKDEA